MRARNARVAAAIPLIACALAGCGDSDEDEPKPVPGKTVNGETETGMKLKVETFLDPAKDPELKKLADWRASNRYPAADFHRVTADNSQGRRTRQRPDRAVRAERAGARDRQGHRGAVQLRRARSSSGSRSRSPTRRRWRDLSQELCADGPPKQDGIAAGSRKVYYLVTDRGFSERGIRSHAGVRPARRRVQVAGTAGRGECSPRPTAPLLTVSMLDSVNVIVLA